MAEDSQKQVRPLWRESTPSIVRMRVVPRPLLAKGVLAVTLLLVALAAAAGMLSWLAGPPKTHLVSCWITGFLDPTIPPNIAAERDRLAIENGPYFSQADVASVPSYSKSLMLRQLGALSGNDRADNVVVYLGAYATVDSEGSIVLLTSDYEPGRPGTGLPLSTILQSLRQSPAKHKLLVLDIFWPTVDPAIFGAADYVASALPKELAAVPDPDRLVLSSCSPGQTALSSEALGRSVFGHYFEQALRGSADIYNRQRVADGRVTVREAAQLVAARVDRWAMHNYGCRQTPVLWGDGDDFELTGYDLRGVEKPEASEVPEYPEWLLDAWKLRDTWVADGTSDVSPRVFRQFEASLLRMEERWRWDHSTETLRAKWQTQLADIERSIAASKRQVDGPNSASLATAVASRGGSAPKATEATAELLAGLATIDTSADESTRQATVQKLLSVFDSQTKDLADVDLATALCDAAGGQASARTHDLRILVETLAPRRLCDRWIETRFLKRLVTNAAKMPTELWTPSRLSRLFRIVEKSEQTFAGSTALPRLERLLEEVARRRHEAEVLFWSAEYVPPEAVDKAITRAERRTDHASARQAMCVNAQRTWAEAIETLPWVSRYVERYPSGMAAWTSAVNATTRLAGLLDSLSEAVHDEPSIADKQLEAVRQATEAVRTSMAAVCSPFEAEAIQRLIRRCGSAPVRPNVLWEIDAVLATPLLNATDRGHLCHARSRLVRRFFDRLATTDYEESLHNRITPVLSGCDSTAAMRAKARLGGLRAQVSLDLLHLGGVAFTQPRHFTVGSENEPFTPAQLAHIGSLWHVELRRQIETASSVRLQDRLSRIYSPLRPMGLLDHPETNPTVRLTLAHLRKSWAWLAARYRYEARDGVDPDFYAKLAIRFSPYLTGATETRLHVECPDRLEELVAGTPGLQLSIPWDVAAGIQDSSVCVDILNPASPSLSIVQRQREGEDSPMSPLVLDVSLAADARFGRIPPRGFLLTWDVEGQRYHHRVGVPTLSRQSLLTVSLSPTAKQPMPNVDRILLRSGDKPRAYYLHIGNDGCETKTVLVKLKPGQATSAPLEIAPGQVAVAKCLPPATKEGKGPASPETDKSLPPFTGPLEIAVLDAADQRELAKAVFPVEIIEPRQFVSVEHVRFTPEDCDHNRLEIALRKTGTIPGSPCHVELDLAAARIPGLLNMGEGVLQGKLSADGEPLTLFARDLQLAEGVSERGAFSLTIDGIPRAMIFDTTFARGGGATTPSEAIHPAIRLAAPRTGRSGTPLTTHIETDYAPETSVIHVGLGRRSPTGTLVLDREANLQGNRCRRIGFSCGGKDGALLFDAQVSDWEVPLDTAGIVGRRILQARLLTRKGQVIAAAEQEVVLGDQPPSGITFVNPGCKVTNRRPLTVSAYARRSIPEITNVTFFLGKPVNKTIPKDAVSSKGIVDTTDGTWSARLALKPTVTGKTPVSVKFTNAAGVSAIATTTFDVTDTEIGRGAILGKVVEGTIPQPGVVVVLANDQGVEQAKAITTADGSFVFLGLKPGKYVTSANKHTSGRRGAATINVDGTSTVSATIELWL